MSDEFKCPEGWEISQHSFSVFQDSYDYIVLRRKKQKPMPEILPGYAVRGEQCQWYSVAYVANDQIWRITASGGKSASLIISEVAAIKNRYGETIWERKR